MSSLDKIVSTVEKVASVFSRMGSGIAAAGVLLMTLLIAIDVIGRFVFGMPTYVATEFSGYLLVIITFLGLSQVSRIGRQIEVSIVIDRLSETVRRRLRLATTTLSLVFLVYFTIETADVALLDFRLGAKSLTFVHTPIWLISGCVPLGLGVLTIQVFAQWLQMVTRRAWKREPSDREVGEF